MHTVQVKTLSKRNPVPFGSNPSLIADYLIICRVAEKPEVFVARIDDIRNRIEKKTKNGKISNWLQPKNYEEFKDNWEIIGKGS
jgi:hypothetical protein